jgi:hypothetical protein
VDMTYEEYKKWLDIKTTLEKEKRTDSPFYSEAVSRLYRRPVPPYPKADARITKDDQI